MIAFAEVVKRAYHSGRLTKQKQFDLALFKRTSALQKKYDIQFDPHRPVVSDDDLVDRVFQAGVELFLEQGVYNISSERLIKFTPEELEEALSEIAQMPAEITIGHGTERRLLKKRSISDRTPPRIVGGFIEDNPNEGDDFIQMYKSVVQEKLVDGVYFGPAPRTSQGRPYNFNTPLELRASRQAAGYLREATRSVGRPGLHLLDASYTAMGACISFDPGNGLRKSDALSVPTVSELKVNDDLLNRVAISMEQGCLRNPFWTIIIGGFSGSVEGGAIASVASALNAIMVYQVHGHGYVMSSVILSNPPVTSDGRAYWVRNLCLQALARNTNLICGGGGSLGAGPGTEYQLYEIAGLAAIVAVAGGHILHGARKSKLIKANQGTGLESRWMAQVARAAGSLPRDEVNALAVYILDKLAELKAAQGIPDGFSFEELYHRSTCEIKQVYLDVYHKVKSDLAVWGLKT